MMGHKFKNKSRTSSRLQNWDYRWAAAYFITICTKERLHYFGELVDNKMQLSNVGLLANVFWHEIKNHAKNIELGEFVVMPNHVHGILILNDSNVDSNVDPIVVGTRHALSLQQSESETAKTIGQNHDQNQGKNSVSSIVGSYKSAVTKHSNRLGFEFGWQSSFYDHIIRDAQSFENIQNYIANNPMKWEEDKFYGNE